MQSSFCYRKSFARKQNQCSKCIDALEAGGRGVISVAVACGVAGIISGSITMTGLANDLINGIISVATEN